MTTDLTAPMPEPTGEVLLYQSEDGSTRIEVRVEGETVWLSLNQMAELFQRDKSVISRHIANLFDEGELRKESVVAVFATTAGDGKTYQVEHFQTKMHWAVHGQTAAEVIHGRVDASKPNLGLTGWAGDRPRKADIGIAKNYLNKEELEVLNLLVSAYLDFAELQAKSRRPMYMRDWIAKLDDFIRLSERDILTHLGKISHNEAVAKAEAEYDKFRRDRHFDETVDQVKKLAAGK